VLAKGSPLPGYKGGSVFQNSGGVLPGVDGAGNAITYREWDVNPYVKGVDRGPERLVTGSDGSAYYTGDHYGSFLQFWGLGW
jgi:guanyl-specific ribonuclease Sa